MKIIHCADLHLDSKLNTNLGGAKKRERKAELLNTFTRMIDYAVKNDVRAVIIAGDMFDKKNVSVTARNTVSQAIISNPDITFYYLKGNHDADGFLNQLEVIPDNLKLFADTWTSYELCGDDKAMEMSPSKDNTHVNRCNVTITGVELNKDNSSYIYSALVLDNDKINIVVLHGQESNYAVKNKVENISIGDLKNKGIDYLALGHIHSYKEEILDTRGVYCYPGCIEGRGFDECGEHGFVLLDIDEEKGSIQRSFVPFAKRRLHTVYADVTGCMTTPDISEVIKGVLDRENIPETDMVKLVLTGKVDALCEKDISVLLSQFQGDYYFLKIYDETSLAVDFNEFRHDESLKGEFVRTVMDDDSLTEEMKAEIIRCGVFALSGEEII